MFLHWRANLADQNKQQPLKINIRVTYHTVLSVWNKPLIDTCQHCSTNRANQALRSLANAGFQNRGVCLQAFPSFPSPPPTFIFWLLFHFSRGQNRESCSSVFLCPETKRKRLLRRLLIVDNQSWTQSSSEHDGQGGKSSGESWNKTVSDWFQQKNMHNKRGSDWSIQVRTRAGEHAVCLACERVSQFWLRRRPRETLAVEEVDLP